MNLRIPRVVVLILNYNSYGASINYVKLLQKQSDISVSILIVDNCSPDGSFHHLDRHYKNSNEVSVIKTAYNGGYAYGNNFGLKYLKNTNQTTDTYVIISNNDIDFKDDKLISKLVVSHQSCNQVAFISPLMHINGEIAPNFAWRIPNFKHDIASVIGFNRAKATFKKFYKVPSQKTHKNLSREKAGIFPVDCVPGSFFMGTYKTFEDIGFFDERTFLFGEEIIIAKKIKNLGLNNYIDLNLKFLHEKSTIVDKEIDNHTMISYTLKSRLVYYRYYSEDKFWAIALIHICYYMYLFAKEIEVRITRFIRKLIRI